MLGTAAAGCGCRGAGIHRRCRGGMRMLVLRGMGRPGDAERRTERSGQRDEERANQGGAKHRYSIPFNKLQQFIAPRS